MKLSMSLGVAIRRWTSRCVQNSEGLRYLTCMKNPTSINQAISTCRTQSIHTTNRACNEPETYSLSKLQKFRRFVRLEKTTIPSEELNLSAMRLFVCCSEYGDFPLFIERFGLEDTLSCWVHLMQLHTWMMSLRLRSFSTPGLTEDTGMLVKSLNYYMWTDIEKRAAKIASGKVKREALQVLQNRYTAILLGYDEGYFTNDKVLAGALWTGLLDQSDSIQPKQITELLEYVHINLAHLQTISDKQILRDGFMNFIPLDFKKPNSQKDKAIKSMVLQIR